MPNLGNLSQSERKVNYKAVQNFDWGIKLGADRIKPGGQGVFNPEVQLTGGSALALG